MLVPEGYTQQEVVDLINEVLDGLVSRFKFGIYDIADIRQEGFIEAMSLLTKYDGKRPLENFLRAALPNKLKNFRRNKSYLTHVSCVAHKEFTKDCEACESSQNTQLQKRKLLNPIDLDSVNPDGETNFVASDDLNGIELKESLNRINRFLPMEMRADYLKMKEGLYVNRERRLEIEKKVWEIIDG